MKRKITIVALALLTASVSIQAQGNYVHRIIVVNEGHYDYVQSVQTVPVTVGAYNPSAHAYVVFDTIFNARFASHVIVDGSSFYVAADDQLIRYDADSYQRMATVSVPGIRKVTVWNNQILVSKGEYLQTFNSYFQVYDKNNLGFLYELPVSSGPQYAAEGIVVKDDVAYIAINNGFDYGNEVGLIGRIDLLNHSYINEIDLGNAGKNPENIILDNDHIITVNNTDYTTSSISKIAILSQVVTTTNLMTTTGCGASMYNAGYVLFQVLGEDRLGRFNTFTSSMFDTLSINRSIYGMVVDEINNLFYVGETDYTTYGKIVSYNFSGTVVDSFDVSVAPGNLALDVRSATGIHGTNQPIFSMTSFPNPAHDQVRIVLHNNKNNQENVFVLTDLAGRAVQKITSNQLTFIIDLHSLDAGVYMLQSAATPSGNVKIIKQ